MRRRHSLAAVALAAAVVTDGLVVAGDERSGQVPAVLSLADALANARASNPELRAAGQEVEIARGRLLKARYLSQFNPVLSGEFAHRERNEPSDGGSVEDSAVTLSQEIEVAGQRARRIREAEKTLARSEAEVRDRERLLDAAVKSEFFRALTEARRVGLQRAVEELNRRVRDAALARMRAGEAPAIEANLGEIRYGQARKETLIAETERTAALIGLRRLLDLPPDAAIEPGGELRFIATEISQAAALQKALAARPDLVAAVREVERVEAERSLTRRLAFPNPTVEAFLREEDRGPDRIAGLGLTIPLPVFDRKQGELVELAARGHQAHSQVEAVRRKIEQEVSDALQRYDAARRTLAVFERDVLSRVEESFRLVETAYRAGKIDLFQLVVVQNDLVAAQLSYLDSLSRLREAAVSLERDIAAPLDEVTP